MTVHMIETAVAVLLNAVGITSLLYLLIGAVCACLNLLFSILLSILEPGVHQEWIDSRPIKRMHYAPQLIVFGLFFWPVMFIKKHIKE